MSPVTSFCYIDSPIGRLLLAGTRAALTIIDFQSGPRPRRPDAAWVEDAQPFARAVAELREYFEGARRDFTVPLAPAGTPFQLRVWRALVEIPYGETTSYGELARRLGQPTASRAVGLANGSNPLPVIIPCHRVIGANGSLTGYGGGLPIKQRLLALERGGDRLF
jgi:methylated-DNA-[protein]-cysteine S-methyltransferase